MIRCRKKRRFDGLEQFIYLPFVDGHQRRFEGAQPFPRCRQFQTYCCLAANDVPGPKSEVDAWPSGAFIDYTLPRNTEWRLT